MLKIKDEVNLEELEKYGVQHIKNSYEDYYQSGRDFRISTKAHHILPRNGTGNKRFDILYDLIQAGLVEKVEEE